MTHPEFRRKLEAIGFGVVIPVFFISSGIRFDLGALAGSATMVPLFLAALLAVRGVPAVIYGLDRRETLVAGLLSVLLLPAAALALLRAGPAPASAGRFGTT